MAERPTVSLTPTASDERRQESSQGGRLVAALVVVASASRIVAPLRDVGDGLRWEGHVLSGRQYRRAPEKLLRTDPVSTFKDSAAPVA